MGKKSLPTELIDIAKRNRGNRRKGARAECELFRLLSDDLGVHIQRAINQTRDGGADAVLPQWSIECKYRQVLSRKTWFSQTTLAATQRGPDVWPIVFYRSPGVVDWRALIDHERAQSVIDGTHLSGLLLAGDATRLRNTNILDVPYSTGVLFIRKRGL